MIDLHLLRKIVYNSHADFRVAVRIINFHSLPKIAFSSQVQFYVAVPILIMNLIQLSI